ncbi:MAG TPA: condensation domain-containing protein, partial [Candidatus Polarisedimenticolia bacterium]|nr:condensation domain-containing protein [Candidatus Polarisedimenticolia bacterium]
RQAAVELKKERLVGYWVGEEMDGAELRQGLSRRLPEYMIPEIFVRLEKLPLTRSGKLNRRALPEPDWKQAGAQHYVEPQTAVQRGLAQVWQEVLGVARVGLHDDFFHLGGHSLNAAKIALKLQELFGKHITIRHIFLNPTVAKLAAAIDGLRRRDMAHPEIPCLKDQTAFPLSSAQRSMWLQFHEVINSNAPGWGYPQLIRIPGPVDRETFNESLRILVERHDVLRAVYREVGGEPMQILEKAGEPVVCGFHDLSTVESILQPECFRQFLREQLRAPIKNQSPLLRVQLVRLSPNLNIVVIQLPHIISDQWTERILTTDLASIYTSLKSDPGRQLPSPAVRYVDYASWQTQSLNTEELQSQKNYWLDRFGDDFARTPISQLDSGSLAPEDLSQRLPSELVERLKQMAREHGTTLVAIFMAALTAVLGRLTNSTDVVIGTPGSGRSRPDLAGVAGLFINPLALRTDISGDPGFLTLVDRTDATLAEALEHQDYPFQDWVRELRRRARNKDLSPYSVVLVVEEATGNFNFDGAEAWLESPRSSGLDVAHAAGPTLTLRICNQQGEWFAELVAGTLMANAVPGGLLARWTQTLLQIAKRPEVRLSELDLLLEADRRWLDRPGNRSEVDSRLVELANAFRAVEPDGIAARSGDGTIVQGKGEDWLDPILLNQFLLRSESTALAAGAAILVDLFRESLRQRQNGAALLRDVVVNGASPELTALAAKSACSVHTFHLLDESSETMIWSDPEDTRDELLIGWPISRGIIQVLDRWRQRTPIGIEGELYASRSGKDLGDPPIPLKKRGKWTVEGKLEVRQSRCAEAVEAKASTAGRSQGYVAPRGSVEREIASVWQEVLNLDEVGVEDDFFALGGSAEKAVRAARLLGERNILIFPGQTTELRNIRSVAQMARQQRGLLHSPETAAPKRVSITAMQSLLFEMAAAKPWYLTTWVDLRCRTAIDLGILSEALRQLTLRHDALRLCFHRESKLAYAKLQSSAEIVVERVVAGEQGAVRGHSSWKSAVEAQCFVVDAGSASLRALIAAGKQGSGDRLALFASSLVVDDASWPILIKDLEEIYSALQSGRILTPQSLPSYYGWLQAAERLGALAEMQQTPHCKFCSEESMVACRLRGSVYSAFGRLSSDEKQALFIAAAESALMTPAHFADGRSCSTGFLPEVNRMVGQFGRVATAAPEGNRPTVLARLLSHDSSEGARFRLANCRLGSAPGGKAIRVTGLEHEGMLFINIASSCFTAGELRIMLAGIKTRLLHLVESVKLKDYSDAAQFSGLNLDPNELKELLN